MQRNTKVGLCFLVIPVIALITSMPLGIFFALLTVAWASGDDDDE